MTGTAPGQPVAVKNIVVLISGRGSNLRAILDEIKAGRLDAIVSAVISNRPDASGLLIAQQFGIPTHVVDHRDFPSRTEFEQALAAAIDRYRPALVVLAGFMRILGTAFIEHYAGRLLNIHPSLLPHFPGLDTHARALAEGARQHGATVHFVTPEVDGGPIIAQIRVSVLADDSPESLASRVLKEEHRLYPRVIGWYLQGRLTVGPDGQALLDGKIVPEQSIT